jgi:hypothetical protein
LGCRHRHPRKDAGVQARYAQAPAAACWQSWSLAGSREAEGGTQSCLIREKIEETPIVGLFAEDTDFAPDKIMMITRMLVQMSIFNEIVRKQNRANDYCPALWKNTTQGFNSTHYDAKRMVEPALRWKT